MWKIRFFQYPRNSVENLHRALYIKLLKTQWLSARKCIPFPAGKGRCKFPKTTRNENIKKILLISVHLFRSHYFLSSDRFHDRFIFLFVSFRVISGNFHLPFPTRGRGWISYHSTTEFLTTLRTALCANSLQNFWDIERIESFTYRGDTKNIFYKIKIIFFISMQKIFFML